MNELSEEERTEIPVVCTNCGKWGYGAEATGWNLAVEHRHPTVEEIEAQAFAHQSNAKLLKRKFRKPFKPQPVAFQNCLCEKCVDEVD